MPLFKQKMSHNNRYSPFSRVSKEEDSCENQTVSPKSFDSHTHKSPMSNYHTNYVMGSINKNDKTFTFDQNSDSKVSIKHKNKAGQYMGKTFVTPGRQDDQ